jgi:hypothetical protein
MHTREYDGMLHRISPFCINNNTTVGVGMSLRGFLPLEFGRIMAQQGQTTVWHVDIDGDEGNTELDFGNDGHNNKVSKNGGKDQNSLGRTFAVVRDPLQTHQEFEGTGPKPVSIKTSRLQFRRAEG